jgi:hypothetical protein
LTYRHPGRRHDAQSKRHSGRRMLLVVLGFAVAVATAALARRFFYGP